MQESLGCDFHTRNGEVFWFPDGLWLVFTVRRREGQMQRVDDSG